MTKDMVSLGSQFQKRPHADSAQIAPKITPSPKIGNATTAVRYASRSSRLALGSGPAIFPKTPCSSPTG